VCTQEGAALTPRYELLAQLGSKERNARGITMQVLVVGINFLIALAKVQRLFKLRVINKIILVVASHRAAVETWQFRVIDASNLKQEINLYINEDSNEHHRPEQARSPSMFFPKTRASTMSRDIPKNAGFPPNRKSALAAAIPRIAGF